MTRTDAATILGIDPSAAPEEAKRAYQELFTEHQVRLTNAPTPALRSLYQARLLELEEARDAFLANSLSDADSDLPTDQPSIPAYRSSEPAPRQPSAPPPPPAEPRARLEQQPPPPPREEISRAEPQRTETIRDAAPPTSQKKTSSSKWIAIGIGLVVLVAALSQLPRLLGKRSEAVTGVDTMTVASSGATSADSLPKIRENLTVARVEFGRGDYDAANGALKDADGFYSRISADAKGDTAVVQIKSQLDSLHAKVHLACDALKKVAERHPGERICKSV
jgi:hypothetical protein